jgi:hypothetical protein
MVSMDAIDCIRKQAVIQGPASIDRADCRFASYENPLCFMSRCQHKRR